MKAMTILYAVKSGLYVNLTNKCPCACSFCIRKNGDAVYEEPDSLWLEHEPDFEEIKEAFSKQDMSKYTEIVFCGYGEPTERQDLLVQTAKFIKENYNLPIRLNTNGLGNLINNRKIESEYKNLIDSISISLNAPDATSYEKVVHPKFGPDSFQAMLDFAKEVKNYVPSVTMTTVDTFLTKEQEAICTQTCTQIGVTYRIRDYAS